MTALPIIIPRRLHLLLSFVVWVTACLVVVFGCFAIHFGVIGLIDPVGTKAADDNDPLGPPATLAESLTYLMVSVSFTLFGCVLPVAFYRFIKRARAI